MLQRILGLFLLGALAGCATAKADRDLLDTTLLNYAAVIRWGNFEDAATFVDPETTKAHPLSQLDLARYSQVRVTGYNEQPLRPAGELEMHQTVEIGLVNNNTQSVRTVLDRQVWRYDAKAKRWWLVSGLPDITQH
jgi:hypothetical protein